MFDALLTEIASLARPSAEVWFRGQSDIRWPLLPRLLRSPAGVIQEKNSVILLGVATQYLFP